MEPFAYNGFDRLWQPDGWPSVVVPLRGRLDYVDKNNVAKTMPDLRLRQRKGRLQASDLPTDAAEQGVAVEVVFGRVFRRRSEAAEFAETDRFRTHTL